MPCDDDVTAVPLARARSSRPRPSRHRRSSEPTRPPRRECSSQGLDAFFVARRNPEVEDRVVQQLLVVLDVGTSAREDVVGLPVTSTEGALCTGSHDVLFEACTAPRCATRFTSTSTLVQPRARGDEHRVAADHRRPIISLIRFSTAWPRAHLLCDLLDSLVAYALQLGQDLQGCTRREKSCVGMADLEVEILESGDPIRKTENHYRERETKHPAMNALSDTALQAPGCLPPLQPCEGLWPTQGTVSATARSPSCA